MLLFPCCFNSDICASLELCKLYRTIFLFTGSYDVMMTFALWYCILNCVCQQFDPGLALMHRDSHFSKVRSLQMVSEPGCPQVCDPRFGLEIEDLRMKFHLIYLIHFLLKINVCKLFSLYSHLLHLQKYSFPLAVRPYEDTGGIEEKLEALKIEIEQTVNSSLLSDQQYHNNALIIPN